MNCIICNSVCEEILYHDTPLLKCKFCGHVSQKELKAIVSYNDNYIFDYFEHNSLRQMSLLRAGFVEGVYRYNGDSFKDILDFGYGSGDFLRVMRKLGWNIFGYDVHSLNLGIKNLTQEEILNKDWNVVTFFDSLEHLENFDFIKKLSKKTDNFIISVPATPFDFPINKNPWKHYKPGEHLHYFSPESLQILFENFNLKKFVCLEDVIRGKLQNNSANINTYHFEAK